MAYKITLKAHGGIEQFVKEPLTLPAPNNNEVTIEQKAIGLNFIDIYQREGLYTLDTPITIGQEASGIITAVGDDVTDFNVGDKVVYAGHLGAYASASNVPVERITHIPEGTTFEEAASSFLRGGTASYLMHELFPLKKGQSTLIHAAAGGVGQILVQWAKSIGATVIATVGSDEKKAVVEALGADLVINYSQHDVAEKVREFCPEGVDVVYDSVGKSTFEGSLDSLKRLGMMVSFGNASGAVPPVSPLTLLEKGALFLTRPNLNSYTATREEYLTVMNRWLTTLNKGVVTLANIETFPLEKVGDAHTKLANREVIGTLVLIP